jgi:putative ABC transport system permease protein
MTPEWIVRASAWLVPGESRGTWRREWLAELDACDSGAARWRLAAGAPRHAWWLQREQWRTDMVLADMKFGWRQVRRTPGASLAAVLTLAIGIGATTAIFSVVYGVLLKPLPYREPERLVQIWETNPLFDWTEANVAPGNLISWRERNHTIESMARYFGSDTRGAGLTSLTLGDAGEPVRVQGMSVSANFFDVLGVAPAIGRTFAAGEDTGAPHRLIVLSDAFWRRQFGADPSIVGREVTLNGRAYSVIGVMPTAFSFDNKPADFWLPLNMDEAQVREVRRPHYLRVVARLKPGVTHAAARADLSAIAKDLEREHPDTNTQMGVGLGPIDDWFVGPSRGPILAFLAAVALVLLIACVNVTNLFLARAVDRTRELAVRAALGANRVRLTRQLLAEAGLVSIAGAALGVALAVGALRLFVRYAPEGIPRLDTLDVKVPVLLFSVALTALVTLAVGMAPAWRAGRTDLRSGLGDGSRTIGGGTELRRVFVGVEVALAAVLLVGATLTLRSFVALLSVRTNVSMDNAITARVALPGLRYGDAGKSAAFFEGLAKRLREEPGVSAAGAVTRLPLRGVEWTSQFFVEGRPEIHGREIRHKTVTTGYLEALGVPVLEGHTLADADLLGGQLPIVVNQALARKFFPAGDALGRRVTFGAPNEKTQWRTVVGVTGDEPQDGLGEPAEPEVYEPEGNLDESEMSLLVRTSLPPADAAALLRRVVRERDAQLALAEVRTLAEGKWQSVARERLAMALAVVFAVSALLLAVVGVYGVASQGTAQRTREIGVRVAFGATAGQVVSLLLRQELRVVVLGLATGAIAAFFVSRAVSSMLYGVTPLDVASYAIGAGILAVAAALACLVPARRALRVDPVTALRAEN